MSISFIKTGRFLFYIFIFLLPFFYIPNSTVPFEANKTMFLLSSLSIIAIFGIVGLIKEGKLKLKNRFISLSILLFLLFASVSTIFFSLNPLNSFFGEGGGSNSLISFLIYGGIFFLALILIKKKEQIKNIGVSLISSISILNIGFLIRTLLGEEVNVPLSSLNVLAILSVIGLTMLIFLFKEEKNPSIRGLFGLAFFILGAGLVLINFNMAWFVLGIASFLIFWSVLLNANFKKHNFALLLITFISVLLFILNPSFSFEKKEDVQVLGFNESLEIAKNSSFLGSGIATFDENFLKYNPSKLQNAVHFESFSTIFTILNDLGILGLALFLIPFVYATIKGFRHFLLKKQSVCEKMSFVSFFTLFVLLFFYSFDIVLMSLLFLFLALFSITSQKGKSVLFKNMKSGTIFLVIGGLSLTLMSVIALNYFYSLNYFSESYYNVATESHKDNRDKGIEDLEKSNSFVEKEKTLIGLSQLYLLKASDMYNESRLLETKEEDREIKKEECESFMQLSEEKAIKATKISPYDYFAWFNLGNIYNNRRYLRDEELADKVIEAYIKATELSPFTKEAYVALIQVYSELGNVEKREEFVEKIRVIDPNYL